MNERRFLFLIMTVIFLLLSLMSILVILSQFHEKMGRLLMDNEKLLNSFYQAYRDGDIQNEEIPQNIISIGLYNFYNESLFLYGDSPASLSEKDIDIPHFSKDRETIIIERDLLNPFIPVLGEESNMDKVQNMLLNRANAASEEDKKKMIRYVYLETKDYSIVAFRRRYRSLNLLLIAVILLIVVYIGHLSLRNLKYRGKIESQERLVMLGTAARTFTHEVKNPLSSIRMQSSLIRRSGDPRHDSSLDIINEEVNRLASMAERISDFLRHPAGNPYPVRLTEEVCRILGKKNGNIPCPDPKDFLELKVLIDPERLNSILDNLINNALESGTDPVDVAVTLEQKGHEVLILIRDKGKGISEENLERILDPFFTTKSTGTGIGLSIVNSFVVAVGGSLAIHSVLHEGTEATVRLPLIREI